MWRSAGIVVALLCLGAAKPARHPEVGDVDAIVVVARPGPPIWHVIAGAADVVILGTVTPMPAGQKWSTVRLAEGMRGARRLVLGPVPTSGFVWNEGMTRNGIGRLKLAPGETLRSGLDPALLARYDAAVASTRSDAKLYDRWKAALIGIVLLDRGRRALGLTTDEPDATARRMAKHGWVRMVAVKPHAYLPTLDALPLLSPAAQAQCLSESLDNLDREKAQAAIVAHAWAVGDLPTLRARYAAPRACEDLIAGDADARAAAIRDAQAEIRSGLAREGRTVVLVDLSVLLAPDFFAGFRADGIEVRPPRE